jgi:aminoglycoside 3-N-acetyltransferase
MTDRQVVTRDAISAGLIGLGLGRGDVVLAHSSMRSFGLIVGGAQALYLAVRDVLGPEGTLVMPSFTPQLCHPSTWRTADLAGSDLDEAARRMPPFDRRRTPASRSMGVLAELLRAAPGSVRSGHPHVSFVAEGPQAAGIVGSHPAEFRLSGQSPLGKLWELDATILMLGTSWGTCTALHLAEYAVPYRGRRAGLWLLPVARAGGTRWREVPELLVWEGDFERLGAAYLASGLPAATIRIGDAPCRAIRMRPLVRFAAQWLLDHRDLRKGTAPPGWRAVTDQVGSLPAPAL